MSTAAIQGSSGVTADQPQHTRHQGRDMTPSLDSTKLVETAEKISRRIAERFLGAGLADVAGGVVEAARAASDRAAAIAPPEHVAANRAWCFWW